MRKLAILFVVLAICSISVTATFATESNMQCKLKLTKSDSWKAYTVTIKMYDFLTKKLLNTFVLTAQDQKTPSKNTIENNFKCSEHAQLQFSASYLPIIWDSNKGKSYEAKQFLDVKRQVLEATQNKKEDLVIEIAFPDDFAGVPDLIDNG